MPKMPKGVSRRSDGRYVGRYQESGEVYVVYGKTAKEASDNLETVKYEVKHGLYCKPNDATVKSWFDSWMETYKESTIKQSTFDRYKRSFARYIEPKMGSKKLEDVQPQMIQRILNDLQKDGYSGGQTKICYCIFKGMFTQAYKNQMIIRNPSDAVTLPRFKKVNQDERRVMSLEEQKIFMKYASSSKYYPYYVTALQTGMRINEVLGLQWSDIDFEKKEIHVSGTLVYIRGGEGRVKDTPKTQCSDRKIPMLPDVEKILKDQRKEQLESRVLLGDKYKEEAELKNMVFTYPEGGVFWDTGIRVDMKKIVKRINADGIDFKPITPHTFRHTFATRCAEQGMPLQVLKTILGHSSLAMTADLYSHVLPDTKREEMEKIVNLF